MKPLLFAMPGNEAFTGRLIAALGAELGSLETRRFPDGETYVRLASDVEGRSVALVCTLDRPDDKTGPLLDTVLRLPLMDCTRARTDLEWIPRFSPRATLER